MSPLALLLADGWSWRAFQITAAAACRGRFTFLFGVSVRPVRLYFASEAGNFGLFLWWANLPASIAIFNVCARISLCCRRRRSLISRGIWALVVGQTHKESSPSVRCPGPEAWVRLVVVVGLALPPRNG